MKHNFLDNMDNPIYVKIKGYFYVAYDDTIKLFNAQRTLYYNLAIV